MLIYVVESRFCYMVQYFLYKTNAQILCKILALLKLLTVSVMALGPAVLAAT